MSRDRVEVRDLYGDICGCDNDTYARVCKIEVVPRKMVEMIIEKCVQIMTENNNDDVTDTHSFSRYCTAARIKRYSKLLLAKFEEGDKE